jgi:phage-related protein
VANLPDLVARLRIDTAQLDRALDATERRLSTLGSGLTRVGIGTGLVVLGQQAVNLTAALAPAVGVLGAIPATAGVVSASLGTVAFGVQGVGDAFKAVARGDAKKLQEAMLQLSPAAREFVLESQRINVGLADLRKKVQDSLFGHLAADVHGLATVSLPTLQTGMLGVAGATNAAAREAIRAAGTPLFQGAVRAVFDGTRIATTQLSTAVAPLVTGLANLAAVGVPTVLRFTEFASSSLATAGAFLSSERGARRMAAALQKGGDVMASLYRIGINLTRVLLNIFKAADAGQFLANLEKITKQFAAVSASAKGQRDLVTILSAFNQISSNMASSVPIVAKAIVGLLDAINSLPASMKNVLFQFLGFSLVLGPLLSGLSGLSVGLKGVITVLGPLVPLSTPVIAILALLTAGAVALGAQLGLFDGLGKVFNQALASMAAFASRTAASVVRSLEGVARSIRSARNEFERGWRSPGGTAIQTGQRDLSLFEQLGQRAHRAISGIGRELDQVTSNGGALEHLRVGIGQLFQGDFRSGSANLLATMGLTPMGVDSAMAPVKNRIQAAIADIGSGVGFTGKFLGLLHQLGLGPQEQIAVVGAVSGVKSRVIEGLSGIAQAFTGHTGAAVTNLGDALGLDQAHQSALFTTLDRVRGGVRSVVQTAKTSNVGGSFMDAVGGKNVDSANPFDKVAAAAGNFVNFLQTTVLPGLGDFASFFLSKFAEIGAFVVEIMPQVQQAIGNVMTVIGLIVGTALDIVTGLWNLFGSNILGIVQAIWGTVKEVINGALEVVMNIIRFALAIINGDWGAAWNALLGVLSGVWDIAFGIVRGALKVLWEIVKAGATLVVDVFKGIWNTVVSVFSAAAGWLFNAGKSIIQGLIDGAGSLLRNIGKFFLDIVPGWIKEPFKKALGISSPSKIFHSFGQSTVQGFIAGVRDSRSGLANAMASMGDHVATSFGVEGLTTNVASVRPGLARTAAASGPDGGVGNSYNIHLPVVPYTPEQVGREAVQQLRNLELVYG